MSELARSGRDLLRSRLSRRAEYFGGSSHTVTATELERQQVTFERSLHRVPEEEAEEALREVLAARGEAG